MSETELHSTDRRGFFRRLAGILTGGGLASGTIGGFLALRSSDALPAGARGSLGILRPPGALEEVDFLARCTRCTRCADACETTCIRFFGPEAGALAGTPYIEPSVAACNLCGKCGTTCPTAALVPFTDRETVDMGEAVVDERLCVSHDGTGICGACHTACPLRNRALISDWRSRPKVDPTVCVGCGLCEEVCIVDGIKAIRVQTARTGRTEGAS